MLAALFEFNELESHVESGRLGVHGCEFVTPNAAG
jgi:hypothetical protein